MFSGKGWAQDGEVEPSQLAVEVFCGDAPEAAVLDKATVAMILKASRKTIQQTQPPRPPGREAAHPRPRPPNRRRTPQQPCLRPETAWKASLAALHSACIGELLCPDISP